MAKRRSSGPKAAKLDNAGIARAWLAAEVSDAQFDRFIDGVESLLESGRLGLARFNSILHRVIEDARPTLREDIERIATRATIGIDIGSGLHAPARTDVFGIPLCGDLLDIANLTQDPEALAGLSRALQETRYCTENSSICIVPVALSSVDLARLSPADLYTIRHLATDCILCDLLGDAASGNAAEARLKLQDAVRKMAPHAAKALEKEARPALGARAFVAVRLLPFDMEVEPEADALSVLNGDIEGDEFNLLLGEADQDWTAMLSEMMADTFIIGSSPEPWSGLRRFVLDMHVDTMVNAALAARGLETELSDVRMKLEVEDRGLRIEPSAEGRLLFSTLLEFDLFSGFEEDFLESLADRYRVGSAGGGSGPKRTLH